MYCSQTVAVRVCATTQSSVALQTSLIYLTLLSSLSIRPHFLLGLIALIPSALPSSTENLTTVCIPLDISYRMTCTYSKRPTKILSCNELSESFSMPTCDDPLAVDALTGRRGLSIRTSASCRQCFVLRSVQPGG